MQKSTTYGRAVLLAICLMFIAAQTPMIRERTSRENTAERQAQEAGMVRMYCKDATRTPLKSPQLPFGHRPFNMEFSVIQWAQGRVVAAIDKFVLKRPACESVEVFGRLSAIVFATLAIGLVYLIGKTLVDQNTGLIATAFLATDFMWLKFGSFIMADIRGIVFGLAAYALQLKRRWWLSSLFWFLCITQKPQAFAFIGPYFVVLELVRHLLFNADKKVFFNPDRVRATVALGLGVLCGAIYFAYSASLNAQNDLPWMTWTGPRNNKWFLAIGPIVPNGVFTKVFYSIGSENLVLFTPSLVSS